MQYVPCFTTRIRILYFLLNCLWPDKLYFSPWISDIGLLKDNIIILHDIQHIVLLTDGFHVWCTGLYFWIGARLDRGKGAEHPSPAVFTAYSSVGRWAQVAGARHASAGHCWSGQESLPQGCFVCSSRQGICHTVLWICMIILSVVNCLNWLNFFYSLLLYNLRKKFVSFCKRTGRVNGIYTVPIVPEKYLKLLKLFTAKFWGLWKSQKILMVLKSWIITGIMICSIIWQHI